MSAQLDVAIPVEPPRPFPVLLEQVWAALASESLQPFMHLWLELSSGAARGLQPHLDVAGEISDGFLAWVTVRLQPESDGEPSSLAPLFLASIKGMNLLKVIGRGTLADSQSLGLLRPPNKIGQTDSAQSRLASCSGSTPKPSRPLEADNSGEATAKVVIFAEAPRVRTGPIVLI